MKVVVRKLTDWADVVDKARLTAWKGSLGHDPSQKYKMEALMCRHSPIQALIFDIKLIDIPSWVSVHFVRHHVGIAGHWVCSQRPDRSPSGESRHNLPQDALVSHDIILNAQELLYMAQKRLCKQASPETRAVMRAIVDDLKAIGEHEVAAFCRPECWWRGGLCPEPRPCGLCPRMRMPNIDPPPPKDATAPTAEAENQNK